MDEIKEKYDYEPFADTEEYREVNEACIHGWIEIMRRKGLSGIEAILDEMSTVHWVGRVAHGWALIRDAAEISVADAYRLFVFRADATLPLRASGQEVDRLALEVASAIEGNLRYSLEDLFRKAAAPETAAAAPIRIQATRG